MPSCAGGLRLPPFRRSRRSTRCGRCRGRRRCAGARAGSDGQRAGDEFPLVVQARGDAVDGADEGALSAADHAQAHAAGAAAAVHRADPHRPAQASGGWPPRRCRRRRSRRRPCSVTRMMCAAMNGAPSRAPCPRDASGSIPIPARPSRRSRTAASLEKMPPKSTCPSPSERKRPARSIQDWIAAIDALPPVGLNSASLTWNSADALVVDVDEGQVVELLQHEVAGVVEDVAARVVADALEEHLEGRRRRAGPRPDGSRSRHRRRARRRRRGSASSAWPARRTRSRSGRAGAAARDRGRARPARRRRWRAPLRPRLLRGRRRLHQLLDRPVLSRRRVAADLRARSRRRRRHRPDGRRRAGPAGGWRARSAAMPASASVPLTSSQ